MVSTMVLDGSRFCPECRIGVRPSTGCTPPYSDGVYADGSSRIEWDSRSLPPSGPTGAGGMGRRAHPQASVAETYPPIASQSAPAGQDSIGNLDYRGSGNGDFRLQGC